MYWLIEVAHNSKVKYWLEKILKICKGLGVDRPVVKDLFW